MLLLSKIQINIIQKENSVSVSVFPKLIPKEVLCFEAIWLSDPLEWLSYTTKIFHSSFELPHQSTEAIIPCPDIIPLPYSSTETRSSPTILQLCTAA